MSNVLYKAVTLGKLKKDPCLRVTIKGTKKEPGLRCIETEYISRFLEAYKYDNIYWIFLRCSLKQAGRILVETNRYYKKLFGPKI